MTVPTAIAVQIEDLAGKALSGEIDGQKIVRRSLRELIEADRYLEAKAASARANGGIRFCRAYGGNGGGR